MHCLCEMIKIETSRSTYVNSERDFAGNFTTQLDTINAMSTERKYQVLSLRPCPRRVDSIPRSARSLRGALSLTRGSRSQVPTVRRRSLNALKSS